MNLRLGGEMGDQRDLLTRGAGTRAPYPLADVLDTGMLDVGDGHCLYWERSGNPLGIPVVFLHGGPGGGCAPGHRRLFDPERYHIIMFDQRGAGRSTPRASIEHNTTDHLVADIERLRTYLGIEAWLVFGGSWGATLALAYGQRHPERARGFILRGVFTGRAQEIDWFLHGMGRFRPDARRLFLQQIPCAERDDVLAAYYKRLCDPFPAVHGPAAQAWSGYEEACSRVGAALPPTLKGGVSPPFAQQIYPMLPIARLEAHYMIHRCFLQDGELLDGVSKIAHLPCIIVQGACDLVCPPETAWDLHQRWPTSDFIFVADAGHSTAEPGIEAALLHATDRMADLLAY